MKCDAKIRPFPGPKEVECELEDHAFVVDSGQEHHGTVHDMAYPGSKTKVTWFENDRRNYHGRWPGPCTMTGCVLPANHPRRCHVERSTL